MPRVLYIGIGVPWEGSAGYLVRQEMFLRALAQCASLHLAMIDCDAPTAAVPFPCALTELPSPERRPESRLRSAWNDLTSSRPMMLRQVNCERTRQAVRALDPDSFDAIFAYRPDFAYLTGVLGHPRLILDIDDPEHLRRAEARRLLERAERTLLSRVDIARLRRFERRAARTALASFVCQERDRLAFAEPRPLIAPNCVDAPPICPARRAARPVVLFLGNLEGSPRCANIDGLHWFVRQVWPHVRAACGDCELRVVGAIGDWLRAELREHPDISPVGFVPRLEAELAAASLSIAPIRFGTGTRIKILQSLAWGCPVVSTPKGAEGIAARHDEHLLLAGEADNFAAHCLRLLNDPPLQARLGQAGHALVLREYDRAANQERLVKVLSNLIGSKAGTASNRRARQAA